MHKWKKVSLVAGLLMLQNPVFAAGWLEGDGAHMTRGKSLYQSGQMDAAAAEFTGAIQANPNLAEAYYWRGIIFSTLKQNARAQQDFDSAISLERNVPDFYMARATLYANQGKQDLAIADYDSVLRLDPYNQEAKTNKAFSVSELGKPPVIASGTGSSSSTAGGSASGFGTDVLVEPKYGNSATDRAIEKALAKQNGQSIKKLREEDSAQEKYAAGKTNREREIAVRLEKDRLDRQKLARELEEVKRQKQTVAVAPTESIPHEKRSEKNNKTTEKVTVKLSDPSAEKVAETPVQEMAKVQVAAAAVSNANRPIKDKWAVIIGISKFENHDLNLRYPAKDAKDFYQFLTTTGNFAPDHVRLLTDKDAKRANILSLIGGKWLPRVANPDDLVVIYVSSHGSSSDMDVGGVNYLLAYDSDVDNLYATGLPMQELTAMIKGRVHSDRVVMILDACHSGAATAESKGLSRGSNVNAEAIAQGTGQLVISSSLPNQVSWESKAAENSVFTKFLMEGLKQNGATTSLDDAFQFMRDKVQEEVLRERGVLQTPVLSSKWNGTGLKMGVPAISPRPGLVDDGLTFSNGNDSATISNEAAAKTDSTAPAGSTSASAGVPRATLATVKKAAPVAAGVKLPAKTNK